MIKRICTNLLISCTFLTHLSAASLAPSNEGLSNACMVGDIYPLETDDVLSDYLMMLYVNFDDKDTRNRDLHFLASHISLEDGHLIFENPTINGAHLHPNQIYCEQTKTNFLGFEVCKQHALRSIGNDLCKKLGLEVPQEDHRQSFYRNLSTMGNSKYYSLAENNRWYSGHYSILAAQRSTTALSQFSCKIPE